jgi:Domain of unknown function (DUF222)
MCSGGGEGLAAVAGGLDALAAEDLFAVPGPALLDRTAALVAAHNRLDAELARTIRRAEAAQAPERDGLKTMHSWLRGHARLSPAAASQLVRAGRALEQLPAVAAAHAAGEITGDQVGVLADVVRPEQLARAGERGVDLAGVDATLAAVAATRPHADLAKVVHHYLARLDQDGPEPDPTAQRALTLAKHADGSVTGRFALDPVGGEKVQAVVESLTQAHRPAGDPRTRAQRLGDALVQRADLHLGCGTLPMLRTVHPHVALTVGLADLADPSTGPAAARLGFGGLLSAARARWAACDADLSRLVLDPDGLPLDVGRTHRLVPPHLRRAVEHRDGRCVFAGCDAPTHWCEVHHLLARVLGGATSLDNSGLLCERHHTQVHHGFRIHRDAAGRWHTYRPDGSEILVPDSTADPPLAA